MPYSYTVTGHTQHNGKPDQIETTSRLLTTEALVKCFVGDNPLPCKIGRNTTWKTQYPGVIWTYNVHVVVLVSE